MDQNAQNQALTTEQMRAAIEVHPSFTDPYKQSCVPTGFDVASTWEVFFNSPSIVSAIYNLLSICDGLEYDITYLKIQKMRFGEGMLATHQQQAAKSSQNVSNSLDKFLPMLASTLKLIATDSNKQKELELYSG